MAALEEAHSVDSLFQRHNHNYSQVEMSSVRPDSAAYESKGKLQRGHVEI